MPEVTAQRLPVPEPDPSYAGTPLAAIDWGAHRDLSDGVLSVGFVPGGRTVVDGDGERLETVAWSAAQMDAAVDALELFATFLPITIEVASWKSADFVLSLSPELDGYGEMQTPDEGVRQSGFFNTEAFSDENGNVDPGGLGFQTLIHEFGHGFGLAHPHDDGGISDIMLGVTETDTGRPPYTPGYLDLNQGVFTTMSYNEGYVTSPDGLPPTDRGFERTPMALDIAVLQDAYGVNESFAAGDDRYVLPNSNAPGTGWVAIWDTGGHDRIWHAGSKDALIDLRPATLEYELGGGGFISRADGVYAGFTVAAGVAIEDAVGGRGDDMIFGNDGSNTLLARQGDDTLLGFAGRDRLSSGAGDDLINGGAGRDLIDGGAGEDLLSGNEGADHIRGGGDDDELVGAVGDDSLVGGEGDDVLFGGAGDDHLIGQSGDDAVDAGPGDDVVRTGTGDDSVLGGFGDDTIRGGDDDDHLVGQAGADRLVGGEGDDVIRGGGNDDALLGGAGSDRLLGGGGNDRLFGGDDADAFIYRPGAGNDLIADFRPGEDILEALGFGFADGAAVLATASASGADTVLQLDMDATVLLAGVAVGALSVSDFLTG